MCDAFGITVTGAAVTITDDDATPVDDDETVTVTLSLSDASISEDGGIATVMASLDHGSSVATTVTVSVAPDTPATSSDYSLSTNRVLTIAADATSSTGTVTITGVDNDIDAADMTVQVKGAAVNSLDVTAPSDVELTLEDDDTRGVTVSATSLDMSEGDDATYTVVLTSQPTADVTVMPSRSSGDTDVTVSGALTFTPINWNVAQTVTVSAAHDSDAADDAAVIGHAVSGGDYGVVTAASVDVAVDDDETADDITPTLTLSLSDASISEGGGIATVMASLDHGSSVATTVTVSVAPDTPATSSDYSLSTNRVLTIAADATSSTGTVTITGVDNDIDAADMTVQVKGAAVNSLDVTAPSDVELTLEDDDTRGVTVSATSLDVDEGDDATYTVVLTSQPTADVTVMPSRSSGDTDVTVSGALTFTPINWNVAQTVTVSAAQDTDAVDDAAVIGHAVSGGDYGVVTAASVDVAVDDDETADDITPTLTLSLSDASISEGGGIATVMASLDHGSSVATTVTVSVAPDTPATSSDYSLSTNKVLTIAAESTASTGTVTITGVDNDIDAADMTVQVKGAAVSSLDVTAPSDVELTLEDDDTRGVTVSATSLDMAEGDDATYTVVLTSEPTADVTVTLSRSSGDTDVTVSGPLTFTPINWNVAQTVTVSSARDSDVLDDTAVIGHAVSGGDYGVVTAAPVDVVVDDNETDEDITPTSVTLTADPATVDEDAGATVVTVTATLDAAATTAAMLMTVSVGGAGDTADAGADYVSVGDFALTIPAGGTSGTETFTLAPIDNAVDEPDKTVSIGGIAAGLTVTGMTLRIGNDDEGAGDATSTKLWLARFGRTASDHVVEAIRGRWDRGRQTSHLAVAGRRVDGLFGWDPFGSDNSGQASEGVRETAERLLRVGSDWGQMDRNGSDAMNLRFSGGSFSGGDIAGSSLAGGRIAGNGTAVASEVEAAALGGTIVSALGLPDVRRNGLMSSSFFYSKPKEEDGSQAEPTGWFGQWSAWGQGAATRFSGADGPLSLDGEVATAMLGVDSRWDRWLAGVVVSHSAGKGTNRHSEAIGGGKLTSTLTSLHPFVHYELGELASVWGVLGYGVGDMTLTPEDAYSGIETDIRTSMAAFGGRGVLSGRESGFELAVVSDVLVTRTVSDTVANVMGATGATSRLRLMLEGTGSMRFTGGELQPRIEAGMRYDGGDAENGAGLEVGGGLGYAAGGVRVEASARTLLTHEDSAYEEWGFSGSITYRSGSDGRGMSMNLGSAWGATQSGVQSLWARQETSRLVPGSSMDVAQRFEAQLGYGLGSRRSNLLWYQYVAAEASGSGGQMMLMGLKLTSGRQFEAGLEFGWREALQGPGRSQETPLPDRVVALRGTWRW